MRNVGIALIFVLVTCLGRVEVWSQASQDPAAAPKAISIRFSNFAFDPDHLRLRVGVPVRLQFINESSGGHSFVAPAFFAASTFARGTSPPAGGKVEVGGRTTVELTLTPIVPGTYPAECTHFLHTLFGMTATIVVTNT